jgi:hypothetical protein
MRRIDPPTSYSLRENQDSLSRHRAMERLADCTRNEVFDPDEVLFALQSLSAVVEARLSQDAARCAARQGKSESQCRLPSLERLQELQERLRRAISALRQRCIAHLSEVRMRVGELAELLAEYESVTNGKPSRTSSSSIAPESH